jgi:hypothetical protein
VYLIAAIGERSVLEAAGFGFGSGWNFPNIIGAINGKDTYIIKPPNSGSLNFSCKNIYSILLLAVVNSNYKSPWLKWGPMGVCLGEEYSLLRFLRMLEDKRPNIHAPDVILNSSDKHHFVSLVIKTFPLKII